MTTPLYWGFYGHQLINRYAVFLLPPELIVFFKPQIEYLSEHAVDPDNRRYMVPEEGPRHYIDLDHYAPPPWDSLPRSWSRAVEKHSRDTLEKHGIVPWWVQTMHHRLVKAFRDHDKQKVLKLAAEIGHYIADAHVPLHACSNHNGQYTGQKGIHGLWESRIPELLAQEHWDFFIGKAVYLSDPGKFIWERVEESGRSADTVLWVERELTSRFPPDRKFAYEQRNGILIRQYSSAFTQAYDANMNGMVERRMREAIFAVASFWYTAWVDAGMPLLKEEGF